MIGAPIAPNGCKSSADGTYTCGAAAAPARASRESFMPPKPTLAVPEMFQGAVNTLPQPVPDVKTKQAREYAPFN